MSCRISADIFETAATYLPVITRKLIEPLIREGEAGVDKVGSQVSLKCSLKLFPNIMLFKINLLSFTLTMPLSFALGNWLSLQ